MIKKFFEAYFAFNKQQRNGLLVLASISFLLLIIRIVFPYFIHHDQIEIKNLPLLPIEKNGMDSTTQNAEVYSKNFKSSSLDSNHVSIDKPLFEFNPNTVTYEQLLLLGFKQKTANTFIKFRSKGFHFNQKEDLKKVYGVDEALYKAIAPYIEFKSKETVKIESLKNRKIYNSLKIEINSADTAQLLRIPHIDLSAAKRILKRRDLLGGYVSASQLKEVYGFDDNYCKKLKPYFTFNVDLLVKMNLNQTTYYSLNKHPYIDEDLAKKIIEFRKKTKFNEPNFKLLLNDEQLFEKLRPYLSFD